MRKTKGVIKELFRWPLWYLKVFLRLLKKADRRFERRWKKSVHAAFKQLHRIKPLRPLTKRAFKFSYVHYRVTSAVLALLVFTSVLAPVLQIHFKNQRYDLTPQARALLGKANPNLTKKLTFDPEQDLFQFNKEAKKVSTPASGNPLESLKKQVGGGGKDDEQLYSVDAAKDLEKGVTYFDNQMQLQFKLIPQFAAMDGEKKDGHLIYPLLNGINGQLAYTTDTSGLKENVILYESPGDRLEMKYKLELPDSLEAKLIPETGEIGVYSADPALFGEISYGSGNDQKLVEQARKNADKTYLTFKIPAPQVNVLNKDGEPTPASVHSKFTLNGDFLTVTTTGLDDATYPLAIDPTVTITSSSEFQTGNMEDNNLSTANDSLSRGGLTGGSVGSVAGNWTTDDTGGAADFSLARHAHASVVYNDYIYIIYGTIDGVAGPADMLYAHINANGTVGEWQGGGSDGTEISIYDHTVVAYNGYMYIIGGYEYDFAGGQTHATVYYAPINGNGSLGAWNTTSSLTEGRQAHASVAHNGYIYTTGGVNREVEYALVCTGSNNGVQGCGSTAGTLGTWTLTNSFPGTSGLRQQHVSVAENGYLYVIGGDQGAGDYEASVYYALICTGSNNGVGGCGSTAGAVGTWNSTSSLVQGNNSDGTFKMAGTVSNGYVYILGGFEGDSMATYYSNVVQYALICTGSNNGVQGCGSTAGTLGTWTVDGGTSFTTERQEHTAVANDGYMYVLGGYGSGVGNLSDTQYALVCTGSNNGVGGCGSTAGEIGTWANGMDSGGALTARYGHASVAYNGYLYAIGDSGGGATTETFNYTGSQQTFVVPTGVTSITVDARGAAGVGVGAYSGGNGGRVQATLSVTPGQTLYLYVGGTNGYNGGGDGYYSNYGGGASDIRQGGTALGDRKIVAGGGGGVGYNQFDADGGANGGSGGGTTGGTGDVAYVTNLCSPGTGGTQSAGGTGGNVGENGSLGQGGAGDSAISAFGGGGGGGYYGGGGGGVDGNDEGCGGGGGSSYAGSGTSSVTHTAGDNSGDGTISISYPATEANVMYAPINSNGSVGAWETTNGFTSPRTDHTSVAYNGYMYVLGGVGSGDFNDVQYAPINSNGSLGTWATTTSFSNGRYGHTSVAYKGYLYVLGGRDASTYYNDVQYAPINANGTVGTWTTDGDSFSGTRAGHSSAVYNGYLYVLGGWTGANANDIQYAPINANGSIGAWTTNSINFTTGRQSHTTVIYNGYLYVMGGFNGSSTYYNTTQYAPINANGSVGVWTATTSFSTARRDHASVAHNGYMYVVGGVDGADTKYNDVQYASFDGAGAVGTSGSTTAFTTARYGHASVAYNGYLYVLGGSTGSFINSVYYASINSAGTVGSWTSTTAHTSNRFGLAAVAYNGYMYVLGGRVSTSGNSTTQTTSSVYYSAINSSTGALGAWTQAFSIGGSGTAESQRRYNHSAVVYNGYLYVIGGQDTGGPNYYGTVYSSAINASTGALAAWSTTTALGVNRTMHSSVVHGGYMYVIGGSSTGSDRVSTVYYSQIGSSGTVGSWSTTTSFTTARYGHTSVIHNGYMYVIGGSTGAGVDTDTIQYAPVNSDGTITTGAWTATNSFTTARSRHQSAAYGGNLYIIGGYDESGATALDTVQYAPINNGGRGTTGTWTTDADVMTGRNTHATVAYNGYLYAIGGETGSSTYTNAVQYTQIASDGSIGSWQTDAGTSFATARQRHSAIAYNGYMYVIGGYIGSGATYQSDVQYALICTGSNTTGGCSGQAAGSIGTWNTTTALASGRPDHKTVVHNGYMYVVGGGSTGSSDVLYSLICTGSNSGTGGCNSTAGTLGTWNTDSGTSFTTARYRHEALVNNGYLYVLGGESSGFSRLNDVQYALICTGSNTTGGCSGQAAGSIGTWNYTTSFTGARNGHVAYVSNGYMYVAAGIASDATTRLAGTQFAAVNSDGTVGTWQATTSIAVARRDVSGAAYQGYLYVTGGNSGSSSYTTSTEYASLNSIPRKATYSKTIDLGVNAYVTSVTYNPTSFPLDNIKLKAAPSTGIFGASLFDADTDIPPCDISGQYIQLFITLDDTQNAAFPDSSQGSLADISSTTVDISPQGAPPEKRLRHGAFFQDEVLQPFETASESGSCG